VDHGTLQPAIQEQYFHVPGKVKPGVTLAQVEADIGVLAKQLATVYPATIPKAASSSSRP
jgi:hypothetical protein